MTKYKVQNTLYFIIILNKQKLEVVYNKNKYIDIMRMKMKSTRQNKYKFTL